MRRILALLGRHRMAGTIVVALTALALVTSTAAAIGVLNPSSSVANDDFVDAQAVTGTFAGTTVGATADAAEVAAGVADADQRVVWYTWTAPGSGWAYVTPATGTSPAMPTVEAFLGASITSLQRVDRAATGGGRAGVSIPAVEGRSYRLAVVGDGDGADFDLAIDQPDAGAPINDHPEGAVDVGGAVAKASTTHGARTIAIATLGGATADPHEPATGGVPAAHSLWYAWSPAHSGGTASFAAAPSDGSTGSFRVAVYRAADTDGTPGLGIGDLTPVHGGADGGPVSPVAGTTYLISVDGPESFFELSVTASGVASNRDTAPPKVTCDPAPTGWSDAATVNVPCTATDRGTGLASAGDAAFTLSASTPEGVESADRRTDSRPVCDAAGNCVTAGPISGVHVDRKPPVVHCGAPDGAWSATAPSTTCTSSDHGSGLAHDGDASRTFAVAVPPGTEASMSIPGAEICDQVGNCSTVGPFGPVKVDTKAPTVTCAAPPTGPRSAQVEVSCTATDAGSGLNEATDASFTLTTDVPAGTASSDAATDVRTVCDLVGNCSTAGPYTGLDVDLSPPSVTCTPDDHEPLDAWRAAPFTITCDVADVGSGLAPGTPATIVEAATIPDGKASSSITTTSNGPSKVCDVAGNCVTVKSVTGIHIDRQAPTVTCGDAKDRWYSPDAAISCAVADADGSGLAGAGTVTLTATLPDGHEGTASTDTVKVCDEVGNCATAGPITGVHVDRRAPSWHCAAPAPAYFIEARIPCTASDGGSGLVDASDASFVLSTSVGAGHRDPHAETGTRKVCDRAGLCATAGPVTASVDLTHGAGSGPHIDAPDKVEVVSTFDPKGPTPVPYALPTAGAGSAVSCHPAPGTMMRLGWTTVVCEAADPHGTSMASFPIALHALPDLAATGDAVPGGAWRAVGVGYAHGSDVSVEVDGHEVTTGKAADDGRVQVTFSVPASITSGDHLLVVRGSTPAGDPLLTVAHLGVVATKSAPPDAPPPDAPVLPPSGPAMPADPGPAPLAPRFENPAVTNPTSTTTTTPTTPNGATTTTPESGSRGNGTSPGGSSAGTGSHGKGGFPLGHLPRTGADVAAWVILGVVLVVAGFALTRFRRRATR